jgi:hypothetical protein
MNIRTLMDGRFRDQKFAPLGCTAFACVCTFRRTSFAASLVIELIVTCFFYLLTVHSIVLKVIR